MGYGAAVRSYGGILGLSRGSAAGTFGNVGLGARVLRDSGTALGGRLRPAARDGAICRQRGRAALALRGGTRFQRARYVAVCGRIEHRLWHHLRMDRHRVRAGSLGAAHRDGARVAVLLLVAVGSPRGGGQRACQRAACCHRRRGALRGDHCSSYRRFGGFGTILPSVETRRVGALRGSGVQANRLLSAFPHGGFGDGIRGLRLPSAAALPAGRKCGRRRHRGHQIRCRTAVRGCGGAAWVGFRRHAGQDAYHLRHCGLPRVPRPRWLLAAVERPHVHGLFPLRDDDLFGTSRVGSFPARATAFAAVGLLFD